MISNAAFPIDNSGNETNLTTAGIIQFDYAKSRRNYDKRVRPDNEIHLHILRLQAETNVKTQAGTDRQEGQQTDAPSAITDLQQEPNTTRASVEDNSKKDDKLTDGVNKGSEDENNHSDNFNLSKPTVNSSFHKI